MNLILCPSLPTSETSWPLIRPTGFLSVLAVLTVIKQSPTVENWKVIASLEAIKRVGELHGRVDFIHADLPPRHDWINGVWETRNLGTPAWANACYEDAVFLAQGKAYAVLRFVRVGVLRMGKDDPCGADRESAPLE